MASSFKVYKRKSNQGFVNVEYMSHGWWIKDERDSNASFEESAELYIGKEPIRVTPTIEWFSKISKFKSWVKFNINTK